MEADVRADIFASVRSIEMATGKPAFKGQNESQGWRHPFEEPGPSVPLHR